MVLIDVIKVSCESCNAVIGQGNHVIPSSSLIGVSLILLIRAKNNCIVLSNSQQCPFYLLNRFISNRMVLASFCE